MKNVGAVIRKRLEFAADTGSNPVGSIGGFEPTGSSANEQSSFESSKNSVLRSNPVGSTFNFFSLTFIYERVHHAREESIH